MVIDLTQPNSTTFMSHSITNRAAATNIRLHALDSETQNKAIIRTDNIENFIITDLSKTIPFNDINGDIGVHINVERVSIDPVTYEPAIDLCVSWKPII